MQFSSKSVRDDDEISDIQDSFDFLFMPDRPDSAKSRTPNKLGRGDVSFKMTKTVKKCHNVPVIADELLVEGNLDESSVQHRKALSIRAAVFSQDHPENAVSCARVGDVLGRKGDFVGASVAHR